MLYVGYRSLSLYIRTLMKDENKLFVKKMDLPGMSTVESLGSLGGRGLTENMYNRSLNRATTVLKTNCVGKTTTKCK